MRFDDQYRWSSMRFPSIKSFNALPKVKWSKANRNFIFSIIFSIFPYYVCAATEDTNTNALEKIVRVSHGIAMHGLPKYPENFKHFDYASPDAKKGGSVTLGATGNTFDSLSSFIAKGTEAEGLNLIYDTLTVASLDEAFSRYGLVAEKIEMPNDRSWVIFHLRKNARFHDGKPITADDVVFTFNTLVTKGHPAYKSYYAEVNKVEALDPTQVKFSFSSTTNKELPLILAELPVLPKHYWEKREFNQTTLEAPLGSGPYRIKKIDPGRSITYERNKDYWAKDLNINVGQYNFDEIQYDYYRDDTVSLEAFKAGEYDFRIESNSKLWATAYTGPIFDKKLVVKETQVHQNPTGMQGFAFNTRRDLFKDKTVRKALSYAFDFEWSNKNLFYNAYTRTDSYFSNSELASSGLPTGRELEILQQFKAQLPAEVFTQPFILPITDGSGTNRENLREAKKLLMESDWTIKDGKLVHKQTGQPFKFEILLFQQAFERIINPFVKNLERLGIETTIRTVDVSQYIQRMREFDFDMVVASMGQSLSPGNEQRNYWYSTSADVPSSGNIMGVKDPVVDQLVDMIIAAPSREELIATSRALDRVLLQGYYLIPNWHIQNHRLAYWDFFAKPTTPPIYGGADASFFTWWVIPEKQQQIISQRANSK